MDSSGTYNLPNFTDRVIQGYGNRGSVGSYLNESLPNISGGFGVATMTCKSAATTVNASDIATTGVFTGSSASGRTKETGASGSSWFMNGSVSLDASRSSSAYQNGAPVQQNALCLMVIIKY